MLRRLIIKNYALIEELEIEFGPGLSIITGETGAGKSIMLGALGLLLGQRADTKAIADKEKKTIVEAVFEIDRKSQLSGSEETESAELIVRRELTPSGRSRAFVDDSPVTLPVLSNYTSHLLDIHSQHANLALTGKEGQLRIIDAMAGNAGDLADYRDIFKNYVAMRNRLRRIREERERSEEKRNRIIYQLDQLRQLNLHVGEQKEVEHEFELLSDADEIREYLRAVHYALDGGDESALTRLSEAEEGLREISSVVDAGVEGDERMSVRLANIKVELKDIADSIGRKAEETESNPALLAKTGARMREIYEAVKMFHATDGDELVEMREKLEKELAQIDGSDDESKVLEREVRLLGKVLKEKADLLTAQREVAAGEFAKRLTERCLPLGLPNLRFKVAMEKTKLTPDGQDAIEFQCSFNKNGELLPMATTASGGELSRLTLGIKSLMAEKMEMPTVIFDEIDTGVSGEIAAKMGNMMAEMGKKMQILTITHLPQVAGKGLRHYKVYKRDTEDKTVSTIVQLTDEERVREIAAMLSGERITDAALEAAKALVGVRS